MNQPPLTEIQIECDALRIAYEQAWDLETAICDLHLDKKEYQKLLYHIQQIAGILAGEIECKSCGFFCHCKEVEE